MVIEKGNLNRALDLKGEIVSLLLVCRVTN